MYCSNCGKEWKDNDKYCGGCGTPRGKVNSDVKVLPVTNNTAVSSVQPVTPDKKGMPAWGIVLIIVLAVLGIGFVGLIALFTVLFTVVSDTAYDYIDSQSDSYVYLDDDEVPTIFNLMGEYEMCDYPSYEYDDEDDEYESITYSYCDSYFDEDVMQNYLDYLVEDYGFEEYDVDSMYRSVKIDSVDEGYIIVVKAYIYGERIEYYKIAEDKDYVDNTV